MTDLQDTKHCHVCGGILGFTPRLGEWIRHPRCHDAVMLQVEAAVKQERSAICADGTVAHLIRALDRIANDHGVDPREHAKGALVVYYQSGASRNNE